jgi:hypothetical protein
MAERGFHITLGVNSADVIGHRVTLIKDGTSVGSKEYDDDECTYKPMEADDPPAPQPTMRTFDLGADSYWLGLGIDGLYDVDYVSIDDAGNESPPLEGALTLDFVAPGVATGFDPF